MSLKKGNSYSETIPSKVKPQSTVDTATCLGVDLTSDLTWNKQVEKVATTLSASSEELSPNPPLRPNR